MTEVPGTASACTWKGLVKSPASNEAAMSRMCRRICAMPAISELVSRSRTIRPPSGRSSKTCAEVYWLTPMTVSPRACTRAKALSDWRAPLQAGSTDPTTSASNRVARFPFAGRFTGLLSSRCDVARPPASERNTKDDHENGEQIVVQCLLAGCEEAGQHRCGRAVEHIGIVEARRQVAEDAK